MDPNEPHRIDKQQRWKQQRWQQRAQRPLPEQVDVAIIGTGTGGLTAGAYLAQAGLRVACFDSHYVAGGYATQFQRGGRRQRYHFDIGLHYLGDCGPEGDIPRILRGVGVEIDYAPLDPDGFDTLIFPDLRFRVPASVERYEERLLALFPGERRGIHRYLGLLRAVMHVQRHSNDRGRPRLQALLPLGRAALHLMRYQHATIGQFLDSCTRDPRLRAVLLGQSGDYGLPPSQVSAMLHLGLCGHYFRGAYYPKGGGQVISDRLAERIEAAGGSIHLRRPVRRIVLREGRACGVELAGAADGPGPQIRARVVLSNADLPRTLQELLGPEHLPASWRERLGGLRMPAGIFLTCLGVQADLAQRGMGATNYWQFDDYDTEAFYRDALDPGAAGPVRTRGCYITSATLKDPDHALHHAPAGVTNVEVMTLVPGISPRWHVTDEDAFRWRYRHNPAYEAVKADVEEQLIARLERLFPGTRERIVFRESATPVTHARFTGATAGSAYGLAGTPGQFLQHRPGMTGPVPGLFLCGASTRSGHGILGAMMGGQRAARRILAELQPAAR